MQNIPTRIEEVKSIVMAVNLKTDTCVKYLGTQRGVCETALDRLEGGIAAAMKESADWEMLAVAPDLERCLSDEREPQPWEPGYDVEPVLYLERSVKPGEITESHLWFLGVMAAARANPRQAPVNDEPQEKPRRDNVVKISDVKNTKVSFDRAPRDVVKYGEKIFHGDDWKRTLRLMYKKSWYGKLNEAGGYAGKCNRKMRVYTQGNKGLQTMAGLSRKTITKHLMLFKKHKIILQHKRGYRGQKCSIWELPLNVSHIFAWKRSPK